MATAQFQLTGRKPLRPKNTAATTISGNIVVVSKEDPKRNKQVRSKPKQERIGNEIWVADDSNKENLNLNKNLNHCPTSTPMKKVKVEAEALEIDSSLAEELSAIRKKLERLRLDKEKTENMLKERDDLLNFQMKELDERGQIQKLQEIEVDRLFRLKELKSYCMRISPIKSLRARQNEGMRINAGNFLEIKAAETEEEPMDGNRLQSPAPSDSSEAVRENNEG